MFVPRLTLALALTAALAASQAHGAFVLKIDDINNPGLEIKITDQVFSPPLGDSPDQSSVFGSVVFHGSIGNFVVVVTTGASKPILGTPTSAQLDLNVMVVSSGSGELVMSLTDTGYLLTDQGAGSPFGLIHQIGGVTNKSSIEAQVFLDFGNGEFVTSGPSTDKVTFSTPASSLGFSSNIGEDYNFVTGTAFSMTQVVTIKHYAAGSSTSFNSTAVAHMPEPSAWMVLLGLAVCVGLGSGWRRFKKHAAA